MIVLTVTPSGAMLCLAPWHKPLSHDRVSLCFLDVSGDTRRVTATSNPATCQLVASPSFHFGAGTSVCFPSCCCRPHRAEPHYVALQMLSLPLLASSSFRIVFVLADALHL